ncbi:MAG: outer membrane beta-barrel protein [Bacteroidetes bacterium]|nr:outer membrane beta-barrel protein [Bacteroidota bacterium]
MRRILSLLLVFASISAVAAKKPAKPAYLNSKHAITLTVTNAGSWAFYKGPSGPQRTAITASHQAQGYDDVRIYYPAYTFAVNIGYTYRISSLLRLETGLTYMLYGQTTTSGKQNYNLPHLTNGTFLYNTKIGYITIPVRLAMVKYVGRSAFKFSAGPELSLPMNKLEKLDNTAGPFRSRYSQGPIHSAEFEPNINIGLAIKAAWGIPISDRASFDIGPVFDFNNLIMPDNTTASYNYTEKRVFTYYAGLDLAFSLGLGVKNDKHKSGRSR